MRKHEWERIIKKEIDESPWNGITDFDAYAEELLDNLHKKYSRNFVGGIASSFIGDAESMEGVGVEEKSSRENGALAGEFIKGLIITAITKSTGSLGAGVGASGTIEMNKAVNEQRARGESPDAIEVVNKGIHNMTGSVLPIPINAKVIKPFVKFIPKEVRGEVEELLEAGSEIAAPSVYELGQLYISNPKEATLEKWKEIWERNVAAEIGKKIKFK